MITTSKISIIIIIIISVASQIACPKKAALNVLKQLINCQLLRYLEAGLQGIQTLSMS